MSVEEISKEFSCSVGPITRVLKECNVQMRPNGITKDDAEQMYKLYMDGYTENEIAEMYNISRHTVGRAFKRNGLEVDRKTYHFNESYFDVIDTQDKAYILGLLWADGYNDVKRGKITIALQEKDKKILEEINRSVCSDRPLIFCPLNSKNENWSNTYLLTLQSRHTSDVLALYGMVQRKSLVLEFPMCIDKSLYSHFIRGYLDGDGSVHYNSTRNVFRVSFVGTSMVLLPIQKIGSEIGVKFTLAKKNPNRKIDQLSATSNTGTFRFLEWIYSDSNLKLNRKYEKYQQYIADHNINNSLVS